MCLLRRMNLLFLQCLSARYRIQSMFPRFEVEFDYSIMVIPHICLIFAETISSNFTVIYCLSLFSSIYCVFLPQGLGFEYYSWCPKRYHWSGQKFTSEQSFQVFAIKWQTRQCYSLICDRLCSNAASFSKKGKIYERKGYLKCYPFILVKNLHFQKQLLWRKGNAVALLYGSSTVDVMIILWQVGQSFWQKIYIFKQHSFKINCFDSEETHWGGGFHLAFFSKINCFQSTNFRSNLSLWPCNFPDID